MCAVRFGHIAKEGNSPANGLAVPGVSSMTLQSAATAHPMPMRGLDE